MSYTSVPYTVVIPSHARVANMPRMLHFFPDAIVCVDEREEHEYAQVVPRDQLLLHPTVPTLPKIRNWILDNVKTDGVVMIDDDLEKVLAMVWRRPRHITHPASIRQIVENGLQIAADLNKSVFCWGRVRLPMGDGASMKSFRMTCLISSSYAVIGRRFRFDESFACNADIDFTLQHLLKERVVLQDSRFYFDHGSIEGGRGGAQAVRSHEALQQWRIQMKAKWKQHILIGVKPMSSYATVVGAKQRSRPGNLANRIAVRRKGILAVD